MAKVVGLSFSVLLPVLTVRYLSQHDVGVYRQVFLVIANAVNILPLGFSMSAYYFFNRSPDKRSLTVLNIVLFNSAVGALAFFTLLCYPQLLGKVFNNNELTLLAPWIGGVIWLSTSSSFVETLALANQESRLAAMFIVGTQFTKMVLMSGAVILFGTVEATIDAALIQASIQICALCFYVRRRFPRFWHSFDWSFFREQLLYALPFGVAAILYVSQVDLHNYFVSHSVTPAEFAIYAQGCFQIPLVWILYESINAVVIPRMSQLQAQGDKKGMFLLSLRAMETLALVYFPLFVFLMIAAHEFITTLFTEDYAASVPIFRINLLLLPFFCIMVDPLGRAFAEVGRFLLKLRFVIVITLIGVLSYAIRFFSLRGIISVVVVTILTELFASTWKACRLLGLERADLYLLNSVGRTAFAAAAAGGIFWPLYVATEARLMEMCTLATRAVISHPGVSHVAEQLGGVVFLAIALFVYGGIYWVMADWQGVIDSDDKERLTIAVRRFTFRQVIGEEPSANDT